jgi:hypothetical protein
MEGRRGVMQRRHHQGSGKSSCRPEKKQERRGAKRMTGTNEMIEKWQLVTEEKMERTKRWGKGKGNTKQL